MRLKKIVSCALAISATVGCVGLFTACETSHPQVKMTVSFDGEDYELVFCVAPDFEADFTALWRERFPQTPLTRIGRIASGDAPFPQFDGFGYEHFSCLRL